MHALGESDEENHTHLRATCLTGTARLCGYEESCLSSVRPPFPPQFFPAGGSYVVARGVQHVRTLAVDDCELWRRGIQSSSFFRCRRRNACPSPKVRHATESETWPCDTTSSSCSDSSLDLVTALRVFFICRSDLALETLALRQQVAVLKRKPRAFKSPSPDQC